MVEGCGVVLALVEAGHSQDRFRQPKRLLMVMKYDTIIFQQVFETNVENIHSFSYFKL